MRRIWLGLIGAVVILIAGVLVLHLPDFGALQGFVSGGNLSFQAVSAVVSILIWLVLLGMGIALLVAATRGVEARKRDPHHPGHEAILLLLAGIIVFGVGMTHYINSTPKQCCGNAQEASEYAKR